MLCPLALTWATIRSHHTVDPRSTADRPAVARADPALEGGCDMASGDAR
jgi:hypothetical protein